jgi:hypothetical protein
MHKNLSPTSCRNAPARARGYRCRRALLIATFTLALSLVLDARLAATSGPAAAPVSGLGEEIDRDVERIRAATEPFHSLEEAVAAGYAGDVAECVQNPPRGAMGYHHLNPALLDRRVELERPEILVYERLPDGEYRLNGVEYIVPFSVWPADAEEPPTVMGQELRPAPSLRLWYLHVWVWLENPSGLFADWNPRVIC